MNNKLVRISKMYTYIISKYAKRYHMKLIHIET